jgi:predicted ATP-binding protein involved in virulence
MFDYDLPSNNDPLSECTDITILYGDNGTGKTTLIRLVYYLLAKDNDKGFRSGIASITFEHIWLELDDRTRIEAYRSEPVVGSYMIKVSREGQQVCKVAISGSEKFSLHLKE